MKVLGYAQVTLKAILSLHITNTTKVLDSAQIFLRKEQTCTGALGLVNPGTPKANCKHTKIIFLQNMCAPIYVCLCTPN